MVADNDLLIALQRTSSTASRNRQFPGYLLWYDKIFNPHIDAKACYRTDNEKALKMTD